MNNEKKDAPESELLQSAKNVSMDKDSKSSEIVAPPKEDSVIIYYSWFAWLLTLKPLSMCARCFIALLSFAFLGKDIDENNLPAEKAAVLKTFTHTIKKNRINRENGKKGAEFGKKGGRPPHTNGLETPTGFKEDNPYGDKFENGDDRSSGNPTDTIPITDTETVSVTGSTSKSEKKTSPHTDADFFFPVFFWRNLKSPRRQAEKFCTFYDTSDWTMGGGAALKTDEQRIAAAKRWEVRDDIGGRFNVADLAMWAKLYEIAPAEIKPEMLSDKVVIRRDSSSALLTVSRKVSTWIETELEKTKVIILPWKGDRYLEYNNYD